MSNFSGERAEVALDFPHFRTSIPRWQKLPASKTKAAAV